MNIEPGDYSVITFATNKMAYSKFALNCARSVLLHNKISVYIVTNLNFEIPDDLQNKVFIVPVEPEHALMGVGVKLYLDRYLQTKETLFIDSDCLCYGNLNRIFDAASSQSVSVVGTVVDAAEFCGPLQAKAIDSTFNLSKLIRFNGGLYYLKKDETCFNIFNFARNIIPDYDKLGFQRITKTNLNEEGLLSIAMMQYAQKPLIDDGNFMTDLFTDHHPFGLNVLKGNSKLKNPGKNSQKHSPLYPVGNYEPIVLHFGGKSLRKHPYLGQNLLLKLHKIRVPRFLAKILSTLVVEVPYYTYYKLCGLLKK